MIEKEDIKIGLEFILPIRLREYEEEVARFRHRQIMGEDCPVLPRYRTDLETLEGFKIIATVGRPFFKVVDSPREYFETSSKPHHLGSFVRVTCDEIENEVFYLSTKDIMERGETLIQKKKVESKEGVVTMINREDIKEGLKFKMPNNKIERKYQVASFRGATDMCEFIQYLTTLKTPRGDKNYVTLQVPLFEVCGGPKPISSADKKDQHCSWVGEYIKVRSDAIWKKPFYISLSDVMQHGLVDNKTLKDVLRNEREGKSTRLIPKKCVAFRDITNDMYDTFKAKNHDYDNSFSELFAECGMTYAYGHLSEKLKRVKSLMSDEAKVKGESMRDSLLDLANYAILTIMELDKTKK